MANLQEKPVWETGIYQLETSDPVLAGPDGVDNLQGKQLANRTAYLKQQLDSLLAGASVAAYAAQLRVPRNVAMSGDGSWNVSFDGSGNVSAAMTLSNSGVTAGNYGQVAVDAKGRVTAARSIVQDDLPSLDWSKVTTGKPTTLAGYGIADGASRGDLQNALNALVAGAPNSLNTLQGLAAAMNNDPKYYSTVDSKLAGKADKATTFAGYGITDAVGKADIIAAAPPGLVGYFISASVPAGWLKANGAAVSRTAYAALFSIIGIQFGAGDGSTTFNLPDLRGEFLRGWDDGRGVDNGRALGSAQGSQNLSHNHGGGTGSAGAHNHSAWTDAQGQHQHTSAFRYGYNPGSVAGSNGAEATNAGGGNFPLTGEAGSHAHNVGIGTSADHWHSISADGGGEARPRNIALIACIKY
ncbi:phage tail protein [Chromobacterium sp. CV08]|uniref:phage tail protein n=1 Tax=Chromobacterium sp. CV08 TaxID=3133274 RepID=UPI003DAA0108